MARFITLTSNLVLVALVAINLALGQPYADGPNVCNKTITLKRTEIVDEPVTYEINYEGRCGFFPCTKTRSEIRMDSRPKVVYEDTVIAECCAGYLEDLSGVCQPVCLKGCGNGHCVEPEKCQCMPEPSELKPGYSGQSCNMYTCMNPTKWGPNCDKQCDCPKHAYCNALGGKCVCRPGWRGEDCSQSCNDTSCGAFELPAVIETELNVIRDVESAPLRLQPDGPEKIEPSTSAWWLNPQLELNIFLLAIIVCLVVRYRDQIRALKDNLYYTSSSGGSRSSGGSIYSDYSSPPSKGSGNSNIANRPLPIPGDEKAHFIDTNLSFASATRAIVSDEPLKSSPQNSCPTTLLSGTKHEKHLTSSHESSKQNIYLDVDTTSQDESFYSVPKSSPSISTQTKLAVSVDEQEEDHSYQVPKSPSVFIKLPQEEQIRDPKDTEVIYEELPFERDQMRK